MDKHVEDHKEKTLEDYEENLISSRYGFIYSLMQIKEPKFYYTKILQLIADDLNGDWKPDYNSLLDKKYFITANGVDFFWTLHVQGVVSFKRPELAGKARKILKNNVKYLFND